MWAELDLSKVGGLRPAPSSKLSKGDLRGSGCCRAGDAAGGGLFGGPTPLAPLQGGGNVNQKKCLGVFQPNTPDTH
jgi:hypothetical protein